MKTSHILFTSVCGFCLLSGAAMAQDRIKTMPGYEQYQKMRPAIQGLGGAGGGRRGGGGGGITWRDEGKSFDFTKDGQRFHYDIAAAKMTEAAAADTQTQAGQRTGRAGSAGTAPAGGRRGGRGGGAGPAPERGRQYTAANSPDGKFHAYYQDRNLWISDIDGNNKIAITTEGNEKSRTKYGTASWVYGEELGQTTAMWWSPDSTKIAFYRFDESKVLDYYLQLDQREIQSRMDVEPYTKVGTANPVVDILVYDLETKKTTKIDVRDGKEFNNGVVGHYVYGVSWAKDGTLLFHRTNRRQNIMELTAADTKTGKCRVVVHEEWPTGWTANSPTMQFLADGKRFVWESERNGWKNYYLYDLSGKLLSTLTQHSTFEVENLVRVDEKAGLFYYMAHDGDNPMKLQLHRVGMDGKNDQRLTDPAWQHSVDIAPDGKHFIDTVQTHDQPPAMRLVNAEDGKVMEELTKADLSRYKQLGLKPVEMLTFKAADGVTDLYGLLSFPSQFDPTKKYPLLISVYGGPNTVGARETFATPNPLTEYGFLVATLDSRSASGRGKKFIDSIYMKLGITEMDDQAEGVKSLYNRPYLDKNRVGIFGTSYGGTSAATCLMRFPDVFQAASSSSPVTDYRNYDTIYAERYMWIPQENKEGFDRAAIMTYAKDLKGRLLLYYGTADNNVHPNNSMQLITALQRASKSFEVQVGPDQGHGSVNQDRMMEFFIENLVMKPAIGQP